MVRAIPALVPQYGRLLEAIGGKPVATRLPENASLSFRPYFVLLFVLLALFSAGGLRSRLRALVFSVALYLDAVLAADLMMLATDSDGVPMPFSPTGGVIAGALGVVAVIVVIFSEYDLPKGIVVRSRWKQGRLPLLKLAAATAISASGALFATRIDYPSISGLGGLEAPVNAFLVIFSVVLFLLSLQPSRGSQMRTRPKAPLSVAFLVPAFNEQRSIAECIATLEDAARRYEGTVRVYIVDNASVDATADIATESLLECTALDGEVLRCPDPGKARALNFGLAQITEDLVVRIDADTLVPNDLLLKLVPHFWDLGVGGATGVPLPKRNGSKLNFWLHHIRMMEVLFGIAFLRAGQGAVDAITVMPGCFSSCRRKLLVDLGGYAEGFNGEDADITVRIARLGYRIVTDPRIRVLTETPESIAQLREQRQRWARGLFHMANRNKSAIWMCQGVRGVWALPWAVVNGVRRLLMIPVLAMVVVVASTDSAVFTVKQVAVIGGTASAIQLLIIAIVLVIGREFRSLPFLPLFLVFRVFRSYVAFEMLLTLKLKCSGGTRSVGSSPEIRKRGIHASRAAA